MADSSHQSGAKRRPPARRALTIAAAVLALGAVFLGGYLARGQDPVPQDHTPGFSNPVNQQAFGFLEADVTTSNERLRPMPGLRDIYLCRGRGVVADVTAEVSGGPVALDVVARHRNHPGLRPFAPRRPVVDGSEGRRVVSFTAGQNRGFRRARVAVRFASADGDPVTVHGASVHLTYRGRRADLHRDTACGRGNA